MQLIISNTMTKVVSLPYSHPLAEKRFRRNPKFLKDCKEFMKNVVKSYVDKAPTDCLDVRDGKVNSVPHTGLYHPREPECIGVVYISYIRTYVDTYIHTNLILP